MPTQEYLLQFSSSIFVFIYFKLILESCPTSGVYLEPKQTSMMQKQSIIDIWQGFKYGSAASFFDIFPLSSFGYWNEYMTISFFFLKVCSYYTHVTYVKIIKDILLVPKPLALYGNTIELPTIHIFMRQRCDKAYFEKLQDGMQG